MKEKIIQFGEGNFLRAFVDYFIDILNEKGLFDGSIVVVQPIEQGSVDVLNKQNGRFTVLLRDIKGQEKRVVNSISRGINPYTDFDTYLETAKNPELRFVISNTTEAGIAFSETDKLTDKPPSGFPGKLAALLYERYKHFNGDVSKGFIFIPCELIDASGDRLKETVLQYARHWNLESGFIGWIEEANHFTNTLVDRIVTGYPKNEKTEHDKIKNDKIEHDKIDFEDKLIVAAEAFHFFAIEAKGAAAEELKKTLPFREAGLDVIVTDDVKPYKLRKVRILNGAHTMSVYAALLCGKETVGEMINDPLFISYLKKGIYDEVIPTLDLEKSGLESFAASVFDRFANPYITHYLRDITLNSASKFEARVLPSILEYNKRFKKWPEILSLSYAAYLAYGEEPVCGISEFDGFDEFNKKVAGYLKDIEAYGIEAVMKKVVKA